MSSINWELVKKECKTCYERKLGVDGNNECVDCWYKRNTNTQKGSP